MSGAGVNVTTPEQAGISAADWPYLQKILALRQGIQLPDANPWDVHFGAEDPILQQYTLNAYGDKFGIPVESLQNETQRKYAIGGLSRGQLGY